MAKAVTLIFENGAVPPVEIGRACYVVPGSAYVAFPSGERKPADQIQVGDVVQFVNGYRAVSSVVTTDL